MTIIAKTPRWLPLLAAVLVAYSVFGVVAYVRHQRASGSAADSSTAEGDTVAADRAISEALGQIPPAPVDSTAIKRGWRDVVPGVDLAVFSAAQRERFLRCANSEDCTCGCGYTLAACRNFDLTCPVSLPRVEALRHASDGKSEEFTDGLIASARGLRERPPPGRP